MLGNIHILGLWYQRSVSSTTVTCWGMIKYTWHIRHKQRSPKP